MAYTENFAEVYEELQKAIRDRSHLTLKVTTDKNGHTRKVWINPLDKETRKINTAKDFIDAVLENDKNFSKNTSVKILRDTEKLIPQIMFTNNYSDKEIEKLENLRIKCRRKIDEINEIAYKKKHMKRENNE